ncbi:bifunctional phosphatase PAP2/diacylglycerol kinase family protein [Antrihabitans sp. YC2-6]|uniref:bifunctional phosphatase PAP2/diacylglycerol kinase family protein n=1 Tax=Antrihabitans sp. YC2-6 TaxID=2799498 RepID=UPI001F2BEA88
MALLDDLLIDRSARIPPTNVDRSLVLLTTAANHSALWAAVAGALAVSGRRNRRAAVRGLLAIGSASLVANGIAKPLFPRRRPPDESVPFVRRLLKPPVSSSFPSGHAASAAAFATAVAIESPVAGAVVAPLAAAVAYSRVHVGVHWPSDVVVGAALGATLALATRRWWAVRDDEPATLGPQVEVAAQPGGAGLLVFVNPAAGNGDGVIADDVRELLPEATLVELDVDADIVDQLDRATKEHSPAAIGVVGGDGTVLTVAKHAVRLGLPLAVFSGGTLNHFARDAGVEEADTTARGVAGGYAVTVDVASVEIDGAEGEPFVNTASLGGYPDVVRLREKWEPRFGKWPAAALAMIRVLGQAEPLAVHIDGVPTAIWMLFVGNGRYSPSDKVPMSRPDLHNGTLDVRYLLADIPFSRTRLIGATLAGTLAESKTYLHRTVEKLEVLVDGSAVGLATDGEAPHSGRQFQFASRRGALTLFHEP